MCSGGQSVRENSRIYSYMTLVGLSPDGLSFNYRLVGVCTSSDVLS